jgi:hypothetical protein
MADASRASSVRNPRPSSSDRFPPSPAKLDTERRQPPIAVPQVAEYAAWKRSLTAPPERRSLIALRDERHDRDQRSGGRRPSVGRFKGGDDLRRGITAGIGIRRFNTDSLEAMI